MRRRETLWQARKWSLLLIAWAVIALPIVLYLQFSHPDMTRTRLFLEYWPIWTALIVSGLALSIARGWFEY